MIKGNERRIIVIEKAEDPYFERIVFYIRRGAASPKGDTLTQRAQRIFEETQRTQEAGPSSSPLTKKTPKKEKKRFFKNPFHKKKNL